MLKEEMHQVVRRWLDMTFQYSYVEYTWITSFVCTELDTRSFRYVYLHELFFNVNS